MVINGRESPTARQIFLHSMPDLATVMTIPTHRFIHLIVIALLAQFSQPVIEAQCQAARFRAEK